MVEQNIVQSTRAELAADQMGVDVDQTRQNDPVNIDAFVPTALERAGDFRNTQVICSDSANGCTAGEAVQQRIFNPRNVDPGGNRQDFAVPNLIDAGLIDPIGQAIINLYPQPTVDDAGPGEFNYHSAVLSKFSARQFDIKLDHHFSEKNRISGRYSNHHDEGSIPTIFGDGDFNDGFAFSTDVHNAVIEHNWSPHRRPLLRAESPSTAQWLRLRRIIRRCPAWVCPQFWAAETGFHAFP